MLEYMPLALSAKAELKILFGIRGENLDSVLGGRSKLFSSPGLYLPEPFLSWKFMWLSTCSLQSKQAKGNHILEQLHSTFWFSFSVLISFFFPRPPKLFPVSPKITMGRVEDIQEYRYRENKKSIINNPKKSEKKVKKKAPPPTFPHTWGNRDTHPHTRMQTSTSHLGTKAAQAQRFSCSHSDV